MSAHAESATEAKCEKPKIQLKVEHIAGGRARVSAYGGVLDHIDQIQLGSERQKLRFAQACNAKLEGSFDEVLSRLEREYTSYCYKVDPNTDDLTRILFTPAASFLPEPVDWVWKDRIPVGGVTILEGDPGVGKSVLLADLAARVSRGFLAPDRNPSFDDPGHDPEPCPGVVWWFSGHDHPERTLSPRLEAAGADMQMVRIAEGIEDLKKNRFRPIQFPADFNALRRNRSQCPRLVIVDPLSAFCGGSLHMQTAHKVLVELGKFANETGAAVVVVRPLNRRIGAAASERGTAGPSLTSEARSALLLAVHPDDEERRVLAVVKNNLSAIAPSLELEITSRRASKLHPVSAEQKILPPCGGGGEVTSRRGESAQESKGNDTRTAPPTRRSAPATSPTRGEVLSSERLARNDEVDAPIVAWHGPSALDANDLVRGGWRQGAKATPSPFEQKKVEEWLNERLAAGPKLAKEIDAQAKLDEVPSVLLRRAKISLGIIPTGTNGHSMWKLPAPIEGDLRSVACRGQETTTQQRSASPSPPTPLPQGEAGEVPSGRAGSVSDRSPEQESKSDSIVEESGRESSDGETPVADAPGSPGTHQRAQSDERMERRPDAAPLTPRGEPIPPEMLRREEELIAKLKALLQRTKASESRFLATHPPP